MHSVEVRGRSITDELNFDLHFVGGGVALDVFTLL